MRTYVRLQFGSVLFWFPFRKTVYATWAGQIFCGKCKIAISSSTAYVCVCKWIGLSSQRLANRCMSHVRKSGEKYNLWLYRWSLFSLSPFSRCCWLGCVPFDLRYLWPPPPAQPADKCSRSFRLAHTTTKFEIYKFSMRPNKQRGHKHTHNTHNSTLFHVNLEFDDKLYECRARYARRDAYAGIWSYILLPELNRNACFAYSHDIFITFTRCERAYT